MTTTKLACTLLFPRQKSYKLCPPKKLKVLIEETISQVTQVVRISKVHTESLLDAQHRLLLRTGSMTIRQSTYNPQAVKVSPDNAPAKTEESLEQDMLITDRQGVSSVLSL